MTRHTHAPVLALLLLLLLLSPAAPTAAASAGAGPGPSPGGGWWPLHPVPRVVAGFDPPLVRWGPGHRGVDLAGQAGAPVRTALAGTVGFAGTIAGRGVVVIDHGGRRTTYEPVTATVRPGDRVAAGERLGRLRLFGSHCLPSACLHWGLLVGEDYRNPLSLVGGGPVRLLPLARPLDRPLDRRRAPVDVLPPWPNAAEPTAPAAAPTFAAVAPTVPAVGRAAGWRQARGWAWR